MRLLTFGDWLRMWYSDGKAKARRGTQCERVCRQTFGGFPATGSTAPSDIRSPAPLRSGEDRHKSGMIEPLSERELEVLRLLGTELSGPEIADRLSVSLNTVRTHTKNIYGKLGVNSRRAAVRRAEESICCSEQATTYQPRHAGAF